jgi:hypothetical protein
MLLHGDHGSGVLLPAAACLRFLALAPGAAEVMAGWFCSDTQLHLCVHVCERAWGCDSLRWFGEKSYVGGWVSWWVGVLGYNNKVRYHNEARGRGWCLC